MAHILSSHGRLPHALRDAVYLFVVVGLTACGARPTPPQSAWTRGRRTGHMGRWSEYARGPDVSERDFVHHVVSPTVVELAHLPSIAAYDWDDIPLLRRNDRPLELVEWDHVFRSILPMILERATSPALRELASRLRAQPAIRTEAGLSSVGDLLVEASRGSSESSRAMTTVEWLWRGDGPRVPSRNELAWAAIGAMTITLALETPHPLVCLSGAPALNQRIPPATLIYFALGVGVSPDELEPRVRALLDDVVATAALRER